MFNQLKYLIYLTITVGLMASCSSEGREPELTQSEEVVFTTAGETRSLTTTASLKEAPFAVYGDISVSDTESMAIMKGGYVSYSGQEWNCDPPIYWYLGKEHSFVAIHPASILPSDDGSIEYSNSKLSFPYNLPLDDKGNIDYTKTTDLLAATHRRQYTFNPAEPVVLTFSHMLSFINISVALCDQKLNADHFITVKELEFSNLKTTATFNVTPASIQQDGCQTDERIVAVEDQPEQKGKHSIIKFTNPKLVPNNKVDNKVIPYNQIKEFVSLFDAANGFDDEGILMLPQTLKSELETNESDSGPKIRLTFTINNSEETRQMTMSLSGKSWEPGKRYNYKLIVDKLGLKLNTMSIVDWEVTNVNITATIE